VRRAGGPISGSQHEFRSASELRKKLDTLEALRGIAAMLVVMYHLQDIFQARAGIIPFAGIFHAGNRGVDLFFVLSGFIIATAHAHDIGVPGRTAAYLYKRACRVYPSVWILTTLAAVTYASSFGGSGKAGKLEFWHVAASALLVPQRETALVNVTWTLTYEVFFYGLFALLIARRRIGVTLLVVWQGGAALAAAGLFHPGEWLAGHYLEPVCLEFGIGMACARLVAQGSVRMRCAWLQFGLLALGAGLFAGGLAYEAFHAPLGIKWAQVLVYGTGAGAMIVGLTLLERAARVSAPAPLVWLGGISYALYLVHYSVITLAAATLLRLRWVPLNGVVLVGCVLLGVAAGAAFHAFADQPIQARLRRLGRVWFKREGAIADMSLLPLRRGRQAW
jgi:peptidoglycan/LPS O-acetylase OafA/YrhL